MKCDKCKTEEFKSVFTYKDKVFCSEDCLHSYLEKELFVGIKNEFFCKSCVEFKDSREKHYFCKICNDVFCDECVDEHIEKHLKDYKRKKDILERDYNEYTDEKFIENI